MEIANSKVMFTKSPYYCKNPNCRGHFIGRYAIDFRTIRCDICKSYIETNNYARAFKPGDYQKSYDEYDRECWVSGAKETMFLIPIT